MVDYFDCLVGT